MNVQIPLSAFSDAIMFFIGLGALYFIFHYLPSYLLKRRIRKHGEKPIEIIKVREGVIEELSENWAGISTLKPSWNPLKFYEIIKYTQLGVYTGDTTGFKEGDKVRIKIRRIDSLECFANIPNIVEMEKI